MKNTPITVESMEVRKVRGTRGSEGRGFTCDLYVNGVKVAECADWGDGGSTRILWVEGKGQSGWNVHTPGPHGEAFLAHVAAMPVEEKEWGLPDATPSNEEIIARLVDTYEERRYLARKCKQGIIARRRGAKPGEYVIWKIPPTPENIAKAKQKHADIIEEIYNETLNIMVRG